MDLPWSIYVVSLPIKGIRYLECHFRDPIPIGLCVLDNTKDLERNMHWDVESFCNLLASIMIIIGGSLPSQYVLLSFLKIINFIHFQNSLQKLSGIAKEQYNGAL